MQILAKVAPALFNAEKFSVRNFQSPCPIPRGNIRENPAVRSPAEFNLEFKADRIPQRHPFPGRGVRNHFHDLIVFDHFDAVNRIAADHIQR